MPRSLFISYAWPDQTFAFWLQERLQDNGYLVEGGGALDRESEIKSSHAVIALLSPDSIDSQRVMQECALARQWDKLLCPIFVRYTETLPWYFEGLAVDDFTVDPERALSHLLEKLPPPDSRLTLGEARDAYLQRANLRSEHTSSAYRRSLTLFFEFLSDSAFSDFSVQYPTPEEIPLNRLTEDEQLLFLKFVQWLLSPGGKRPYKLSTVELRLAGVQNWFHFLDDQRWLPASFWLGEAKRLAREELDKHTTSDSERPRLPEHIDEVVFYYDTLEMPAYLRKADVDSDRVWRWQLTRLRNCALLHTLAETGGRVSEILSLNLEDFRQERTQRQAALRIEVTGKGGHTYRLNFQDSLPAIRGYIRARGKRDGPLFVSHDRRYDGHRMSRIVAWRVVQRAAHAIGFRKLTPKDFRHWRAQQLIAMGYTLDDVQEYLGHRSIETIRMYYAAPPEEDS